MNKLCTEFKRLLKTRSFSINFEQFDLKKANLKNNKGRKISADLYFRFRACFEQGVP